MEEELAVGCLMGTKSGQHENSLLCIGALVQDGQKDMMGCTEAIPLESKGVSSPTKESLKGEGS